MTDLDGYASQKIESLRAQAGLLLPRNGRRLQAFAVARKRDPPRQRFPSRGPGHRQKKKRKREEKHANYFFHIGIQAARGSRGKQKRKKKVSFSECVFNPLVFESERTITWNKKEKKKKRNTGNFACDLTKHTL